MVGRRVLGQEQLNILLIDDNVFIQNCINQCLQHMGFRGMRVCSNGIDAIEFLRPQEKKVGGASQPLVFDLVICDLIMPQLNGLQLLQWIRTNKDSPNRFLPFVMISGAADQEQVHAARDTGHGGQRIHCQALFDRIDIDPVASGDRPAASACRHAVVIRPLPPANL